MRRYLVLAAWLVILSPYAFAQHGSGIHVGAVAAHPAVVSAPAVRHVTSSGAVRMSAGTRIVARTASTQPRTRGTVVRVVRPSNIAVRSDDDFNSPFDYFGAPGLGFDAAGEDCD